MPFGPRSAIPPGGACSICWRATDSGTASGLSRELPVTRQAVAKHLAVLERAGLVRPTHTGREVRYGIDPAQFARAVAQVTTVGQAWDARLQRIKAIAEAIERAASPPTGQ